MAGKRERSGSVELITAADVLYDPENRPLLEAFRAQAGRVLLADSRVRIYSGG